MAFWNLSVTIGNLWVLVANAGVQNSAVTKFIASTGFGVTPFQMLSAAQQLDEVGRALRACRVARSACKGLPALPARMHLFIWRRWFPLRR